MPVCDQLDILSNVTHTTTANSRNMKKQKVDGKRCRGSSVDRAEPREGSSRHGHDEADMIQLAGCKTRLRAFWIQRIHLTLGFYTISTCNSKGTKITWSWDTWQNANTGLETFLTAELVYRQTLRQCLTWLFPKSHVNILLTNEKRPDQTNIPGKFSVKNLWVNVSWSSGFHCVLFNVPRYTAEDRVCEFKES